MNAVTYVLKSQGGQAVLAADTLQRAREMQAERASKNVHLRLVEVRTTEREIA